MTTASDRQRFWWKVDRAVRDCKPGDVLQVADCGLRAYVELGPFGQTVVRIVRDPSTLPLPPTVFPPPRTETQEAC